jgi:putative ABC transport system permease protein
MTPVRPPRLAERWLHAVLPADVAQAFCGDLAEEYARVGRARRWPAAWYWWQTATVTARYLIEALSLSPRSSRSVVLGLSQDVRFGARSLARAPLLSLFVILTLAATIGVTTAIVSIVDVALLRPFPYTDGDRLVQIELSEPQKGVHTIEAPYLTFLEWRQRTRTFDGLAAHFTARLNLGGDQGPEPLHVTFASASLFPILGVEPVLGGTFTPADDAPGSDFYKVVISHALWQRRFGGASDVLGRRVLLDMEPYTVIGVMPRGFGFPFRSDAWAPAERWSYRTSPTLRSHRVLGRLTPTATIAQARSDLASVSLQLERQWPQTHEGLRATAISLRDAEIGDVKPYLLLLLGAAGALLLIACANVATLMTVRGIGRIPEFAVRRALGMSRWRLVRQLAAENLLLGISGGALGLFAAIYGVGVLPHVSPIELPLWLEVRPDARMLLASMALTLTTTVIFGLAPAAAARRGPSATRAATMSGTTSMRPLLTGGQVALSVVLLVSAGLFVRTARNLNEQSPGFRAAELVTAHLSLAYDKFPKQMPVRERIVRQTAEFRRMEEELERLPGVERVAGVDAAPFESLGARGQSRVTVEGQSADAQARNPYVDPVLAVSPDYFRALGVPLFAGRAFDDRDDLDRPRVAIVNRGLAERLWPRGDAVGQRLKFGAFGDSSPWRQIVGIVGDVKHRALDSEPEMVVYLPDSQSYPGTYTFVMRTAGVVPDLAAVQAAVASVDPYQAVFDVRTMPRSIARTTWPRTLAASLLTGFASLALLLAAIGIYGVLSHTVAQRAREIGVRLALGAQFGDVMRLVLRQGLSVVIGGLVSGLLLVFFVTRPMAGLLFRVEPLDPATFASVCALLLIVALIACYLPARRAAHTDLNTVLRRD